MKGQKRRAWIANAILILGSTCMVLFFSEIALRLFYPQQLGVWYQTRDGLSIHRPNSSIKYLGHEIRINSLGMRDREHTVKKKDGVFRILLMGDSFMEALQVAFDESLPTLLETRLHESGFQNVEVINAAVSGWGTEDELAYLVRYGWKLEPDLILVAMTLHNDVSDNMRERFYTLSEGRLEARPIRETPAREYLEIQVKGFIASHSHLFQLWRKYWYRDDMLNTGRLLNRHVVDLLTGREAESAESMARGWQLTFLEFTAIQLEGRKINAETAVVLIPLSFQLSNEEMDKLKSKNNIADQDFMDRRPQEMLIRFGSAQGIEIIDLLPVFSEWLEKQKKPLYFTSEGHWNRYGHLVGANSVASELSLRGLVKRQSDHQQ